MFVSESNIFQPNTVKIKVSSMDGVDVTFEVNLLITVDHLKVQVAAHLYDPVESVKTSLYHRLLHVRSGKILLEENTLMQYDIQDNDEFLFIKKRVPGPSIEGTEAKIREDSKKTPSAEKVHAATQHLQSLNMDRDKMEDLMQTNFKEDLKKILVSLIDAAQRILCFNPEAAKIFDEAEKYLTKPEPALPADEDQEALKQLTAMGFQENLAKKALHLNHMSTNSAIQWLLEHEGNVDGAEGGAIMGSSISHEETNDDHGSGGVDNQEQQCPSTSASPVSPALKLAIMKGPEKVKKMLEGFRTYRRKNFRPNPKALRTLIEMGFTEKDALDALCIHANHQEEACEWLLNGGYSKDPDPDLKDGLDPESPVYKAILSNPVVQLGISNPKSILAFLTILENPNSTQQWLSDPDTGPMLIQISRIYHAERHIPKSS
ncbi:hypothetical protein LSH36_299g03002 [Paralvinella palmiformis]|uniref:Ubiquitin-associated domain-containing protein 1 n=1 Tax=Paralvinella palmiformis TaxID=53620 RepID=A0AAD9JHQ9_9ANNE|nr:hypothetical protein LSH36_299g03002 [Paralvinella palmiformis]